MEQIRLVTTPGFRQWENRTSLLADPQSLNTHDLQLIDSDLDGSHDLAIEVFGGPFEETMQPRLYEIDGTGRFREVTFGQDGLPGGTGASEDRLPPLGGNYNELDAGDVDGDGCADLVLAGFLQPVDDPDPEAELPLGGTPNRLVFQRRDLVSKAMARSSSAWTAGNRPHDTYALRPPGDLDGDGNGGDHVLGNTGQRNHLFQRVY